MTPPANATFLVDYPEFSKAPESLVTSKLAQAGRRTNAEVFADAETANDALCLRAAILLYKSPYSRKAKLVSDEQGFVWAQELYELQRSATMGLRVF
jgi:hypothetical protein